MSRKEESKGLDQQDTKDIVAEIKRILGKEWVGVLELIKGLTDTFSMSEWNVIWVDDNGKSHGKRFYWKTEAREFYDTLPYYQKRLERVSWWYRETIPN